MTQSLLRASSIAMLSGIRHAFFTRDGGVSNGVYRTLTGGLGSRDAALNVRENRARMAFALGCEPQRLVTAYQIHSPEAVVAEKPWTRENAPRGDAVVTRAKGLAVGVTTADCGPVLFADPEAGVVAAAHAGWKGALGGILEATIATMERLGAARARVRVALGPMIRQPSYEVGPEFIARFTHARLRAPRQRHCARRFVKAGGSDASCGAAGPYARMRIRQGRVASDAGSMRPAAITIGARGHGGVDGVRDGSPLQRRG